MTRDQLDTLFDQEEEFTRGAVERCERRRAEFAQLRAKIDRIKLQAYQSIPRCKREKLTEEELAFLLCRRPGYKGPPCS
jgi:hypothetical protein